MSLEKRTSKPMRVLKVREPSLEEGMRWRFRLIILKWLAIIFGFIYVMWAGLWAIIFVWIPWLLEYNWRLLTAYLQYENGLFQYLNRSGFWWFLAALSIIFLVYFEWAMHYRHKRRGLLVNGEPEGRVVWIKGIRRGLLYDVWDAYNYIQWARGKKKGWGPQTLASMNGAQTSGTRSLQWPDAWAIPAGSTVRDHYIIYLKRRFFQMVPDILVVPVDAQVQVSFFSVSLRLVRWRRIPNPGLSFFFGWTPQWVYTMTDTPLEGYSVQAALATSSNRNLLGRSRSLIRDAIESDPETVKGDYEKGSIRVPTLTEEASKYDQ